MRRGPLKETAFALLFAGRAISSLGDRLVPVALAFAVLDLTGSVTDLGIVLGAQSVPLVVFVLLGGVWADRLPRQWVMLASDGVRAVAQGASAALLLSGSAHVWEIAALQALYGAGEAFFVPASTAVVPQTVSSSNLQQANALLGLSGNVATVLGPALAGVIVATAGPGWGLAADAATFVASAAFLSFIRVGPIVATARTAALAELRAGWRAFRSRAWLWISVLYFTLFVAFVLSPLQVLGPQVARSSLGGPGAWAAISTALGLGALLGGVLGMRWRPRHPLRAAFLAFLLAGPALFVALAAHGADRRRLGHAVQHLLVHRPATRDSRRRALARQLVGLPRDARAPANRPRRERTARGGGRRLDHALRRRWPVRDPRARRARGPGGAQLHGRRRSGVAGQRRNALVRPSHRPAEKYLRA